ncbi:hypothetical protein LR48_Vigan06g048800 [Vigna angularis]|uniref:AAA-ATPase protein n=2 Tax=Phaseolus angularis TaxID=3914 RepID=A0A0L9URG3_PHAAN|nr:AAA-ATPase At3g50940 [Vigna angularis]KAG2376134.1 AAA-ATPase protein [Vigna angularis]KOM45182.1 hypothetical protein LR48_Vigan06g048800 [Vigna angularis]BAU00036.1 hypothetical protein VIGAN_10159300 [Vigna angularis var. angularis]
MRPSVGSFSSSFTNVRSASSWFELYAAFSTFIMLLRSAINDLIPQQVRSFVHSKLKAFFSTRQKSNVVSLQVTELWDGHTNQLFQAVQEYLPARITHSYKSLKVGKISKHKNIVMAVDGNQDVVDVFEGIKLKWKLVEQNSQKESDNRDPLRPRKLPSFQRESFTLTFDEKHRDVVMNKYLEHVLNEYQEMQAKQRTIKIHSIGGGRCWQKSDLTHPASFQSLALDPEQKQGIIDDLDRFLRRKELYKKVGKPWKRGYLLYGPPGTGKSSLIAAMADHLKFDVYDLELTSVFSNSDLMRTLKETANRSIIVIEDIDCNREVHVRSTPKAFSDSDSDDDHKHVNIKTSRFTLSGLLNYMDGLWSSGGEERILIFTTNHRERIDPALLRPGRMDMHIHLSFLRSKAFRILASNYLGVEGDHPLFEQIDDLLEKIDVTPAVVAEQLMRHEDPDVCLEALVQFLKQKAKET